jgi:hypothetical protein
MSLISARLENLKVRLLYKAWRWGLYTPPDRRILEGTILPALAAQTNVTRVLFVGVREYTRHYPAFFAGKLLVTIDPDPAVVGLGAATHIVDGIQNLTRHFGSASFDAIVMNGVIGWGLDAEQDIEAALEASHICLAEGGLLVLGINEQKPNFVDPRLLPARHRFRDHVFPALGTSSLTVQTPVARSSHTFLFWAK